MTTDAVKIATKPDIPAEVRAELARRGWSVTTLAERTGIKYVTLYRRLGGVGDGNLTVPELTAICEAFNIPTSEFVARAEAVAA